MNEKELRDHQRREKSRERLRARLEATIIAARDVDQFWADHPEVHGHWHLIVNHYGSYLMANAGFVDAGVKLLPFNGRGPLLDGFWSRLGEAVARLASEVRTEIETAQGTLTGSVSVTSPEGLSVHSGWQWQVRAPAT